ncbi:phosphate ABC transporter substrate-binding protein [Maioricimonas sp. JC845]|uniref:phosphate ABC transporter substrate-binding protein n=1 Tax=Maioricimonas sp. JC845 TaxID=3232138 RepID=UPI00345781CA
MPVIWNGLSVAFAVLVLCCGIACTPGASSSQAENTNGSQLSGRLTLTGSSTIAPLMAEIGRAFEAQHPDVRIDVQTGGSSRGIADARSGLADIGMVSRALKEDEQDLQPFPVAKDGICIIVHHDNPVRELTDEQIVAIYTGSIDNWKDVGGSDGEITVVNKAQGRSTLELFLHYFHLNNTDVAADVVIGDNEQGIKTVAGNPQAIGYVSIGTAEFDAGQGVPIALLPIGGIPAGTAAVAEGRFPLSRPLNLVTREEPTGLAATFIEFARSPDVHDLIRRQSFVPLAE